MEKPSRRVLSKSDPTGMACVLMWEQGERRVGRVRVPSAGQHIS